MAKKEGSPIITYVIYDKRTGRIVHKHRSFDVEKEEYCECDPKVVKGLTSKDYFAMKKVTNNDQKNLDVIMTRELPESFSPGISGFFVDIKSKKVVEKPKLLLSSDQIELVGDGKDKSLIEINVANNEGNVVESYNGTVKVSTSRGKLSSKGGLVKMEKGVGNITIISANETVDRVKVTAKCLDGKCVKAGLDLEFV